MKLKIIWFVFTLYPTMTQIGQNSEHSESSNLSTFHEIVQESESKGCSTHFKEQRISYTYMQKLWENQVLICRVINRFSIIYKPDTLPCYTITDDQIFYLTDFYVTSCDKAHLWYYFIWSSERVLYTILMTTL